MYVVRYLILQFDLREGTRVSHEVVIKFYLHTYYKHSDNQSYDVHAVSFTGNGRYQFKKDEIRHIEGIV